MLANHLKEVKSILCLNGMIPDRDFFLHHSCQIVAADGAADKLKQIGIKPNLIIGDLDSVRLDEHEEAEIVHRPDQNSSDFEKGLAYLKAKDLFPVVVCGVGGGVLDHVLYNINVVAANDCIFYDPPLIGRVLTAPTTLSLRLDLHTKLSLIAMPMATVKTSGLKWNLNNDILEFPGANSCFNRSVKDNIEIEIVGGKILLLIYLEHVTDCGVK